MHNAERKRRGRRPKRRTVSGLTPTLDSTCMDFRLRHPSTCYSFLSCVRTPGFGGLVIFANWRLRLLPFSPILPVINAILETSHP